MFFLARPGLYVRQIGDGVWIIFIVFKGNDLHSGFSPNVDQRAKQMWLDSAARRWNNTDSVNRAAYVCYPSTIITSRKSSLSISPSPLFGNNSVRAAKEVLNTNFLQHGYPSLGDFRSFYNRLGREMVFAQWNQAIMTGLSTACTPTDMLQRYVYINEDGEKQALDPAPFDPIVDADYVLTQRGIYKHFLANCTRYNIFLRKYDYKRVQMQAANQAVDPSRADRLPALAFGDHMGEDVSSADGGYLEDDEVIDFLTHTVDHMSSVRPIGRVYLFKL